MKRNEWITILPVCDEKIQMPQTTLLIGVKKLIVDHQVVDTSSYGAQLKIDLKNIKNYIKKYNIKDEQIFVKIKIESLCNKTLPIKINKGEEHLNSISNYQDELQIDITSQLTTNEEILTLDLQAQDNNSTTVYVADGEYSYGCNIYTEFAIEKYKPIIDFTFSIFSKEKSYYQEYEIDDRNVTKLDLLHHDYSHIHSDAMITHNNLFIPLAHIYEPYNKASNKMGKGWRSNLHQYLIKNWNYNLENPSREIYYIDGEGKKHIFEEKWYYEENNEKHYIDKSQVYLDDDQKFKIQCNDGNSIEVNYEIKNENKLTLVLGSNLSIKNTIKHKKKKFFIQLNNKKLELEQDEEGYLLVPHFRFNNGSDMTDSEKRMIKVKSFGLANHFELIEFIPEDNLAKDEIIMIGDPLYKTFIFSSYNDVLLNDDGTFVNVFSKKLVEKKIIKQKVYQRNGSYYTKYLPKLLVWSEGFNNIDYQEDYKELSLIVEEEIDFINNEDIFLYENDDIKQIKQTIKNYENMILSLKENIKNQYLSLKNMDNQDANSLLSTSEYYKSGQNHLSYGRYAFNKINEESKIILNESVKLLYQSILKNEKTLEKYEFELENFQKQKEFLIKEQRKQVNDFIMDENGNTLGFDGYGRLILIQDKEENKIQIEFGYEKENEGKLLAVYSETERIRFDYDKTTGLLNSIVDSQGRKTKYQYDSNENLVEITYNDHQKTKFSYNSFSIMNSMLEKLSINAIGNKITIQKDCFDGEIKQDTQLADDGDLKNIFSHSYIFNSANVSFKDEILEKEEVYIFINNQLNQKHNDDEGIVLNYEEENLIEEVHFNLLKTKNILNSNTIYPDSPYFSCQLFNKQLTNNWLAAKVKVSQSFVKDFTDYTLRLKVSINSIGENERIVEKTFSNTTELILPFKINPKTIEDATMEMTIVNSDGSCNPTTLGEYSFIKSEDEISYEYDEKNRIIKQKSKDLTIQYLDYDADDLYHQIKIIDKYNEEVTTDYSYNANKQLMLIEDSKGNVEEYYYDEKGNLIEKRSFNKKDASLIKIETPNESEGKEKIFTQYDKNTGDLLSISSSSKGMNNSTSFTYNYGLLTSMMHHGMKVNYAYDGQGRKTSVSLNGLTYLTTTYEDDCDKRTSESEIDLKHSTNIISTYANGYKTENLYDRENRLRRQYLDNKVIIYDYDNENRLIKTTYSDNTPNEIITYEDDKIKKITKGNFSQSYTYDEKDNVKTLIEKIDNVEISNQTHNYVKNLNRFLITTNYGNLACEHDALNRIIHNKFVRKNVSVCHEYSYLQKDGCTYDNIAQDFVKVQIRDENDKIIPLTETYNYEYDNQGNIISIDSDDRLTRYQYDELNRLVREDNPFLKKTIVYKYDTGGNILLRKTYGYNVNNIVTLSVPKSVDEYAYQCYSLKDQLVSYNGKKCSYDIMGRPTTYKDVQMTWNKNGTLASIGNDISYTYNANGIRTKKVVNGVETNFLLDGTRIIRSTANNVEIIYRYILNKLVGFCYNDIKFIYERNILGDIIRIYNSETGEIVGEYAYDGYGNHIIIKDVDGIATLNPFRYRGYFFDSESNLFYLNSRYYDSEVGRFISPDIISILDETRGQINGLNLYMYCGNNPIMNVDPSGYAWWNWIVSGLQFALGLALTITGIGTGLGLTLMGCGAIGMIGLMAPEVGQLIGGLGTISNGIGAVTSAISLFAFGPIGIVSGLVLGTIRLATTLVGINDVVTAFTGTNYIQRWTGMSDNAYGWLNIGLNLASGLGQIATPFIKQYTSNKILNSIARHPEKIAKYNLKRIKKYGSHASKWVEGVLKRGEHQGQGYTLTHIKGEKLGYIQYHPGSRHHFNGHPYMKVTAGNLFKGTIRYDIIAKMFGK